MVLPTEAELVGCLATLSDLSPLSTTVFDLRPLAQRERAWVPGALRPKRSELAVVVRQVHGRIVLVGDGADDVDLLERCTQLNRIAPDRVRVLPGGLRQLGSAGWSIERGQSRDGSESLLAPERLLRLLDSGIARFLDVAPGGANGSPSAGREIEAMVAIDSAPTWPQPVLDRLRPTVYVLPDHDPVGHWSPRLGLAQTDHVLFYNGGLDAIRQLRHLHAEVERARHALPSPTCDRLG